MAGPYQAGGGGSNTDRLDWPELFRACAERFGWPPDAVLDLTALEASMLLGADIDRPARRTVWMSPQEYRQWLASRKR